MLHKPGEIPDYPIPYHESWEVIDTTKLKSFLECPRKFFFEHLLGWQFVTPSIHLEFGKALHKAMEVLEKKDYTADSVADAYQAFEQEFYKTYSEDSDFQRVHAAKTPANALKALIEYAKTYRDDHEEFNFRHIEVGGTVPLDEAGERRLHFRQDTIVERISTGRIFSLEHKTASSLSRTWTDQWTLSLQVGTYFYVLYLNFEPEQIEGVIINGIAFKITEIDFMRVPVFRSFPQTQTWLWLVNEIIDEIQHNLKMLELASPEHDVLAAFRQNPEGCNKWSGCPYLPYCSAWQNPLRELERKPYEFGIKFWDPSREDKPEIWLEKGKFDAS